MSGVVFGDVFSQEGEHFLVGDFDMIEKPVNQEELHLLG